MENLGQITQQSCSRSSIAAACLATDQLIDEEACTMVSKSSNDHTHENLGKILSRLSHAQTEVLRNTKCNLAVLKLRTAYGQMLFEFCGADEWNRCNSEMNKPNWIQSFNKFVYIL